MSKIVNKVVVLAVFAMLFMQPASMLAQDDETISNLAKSFPWLSKNAKSKLEAIEQWQQVKARYDEAVAERDSISTKTQNLEKKGNAIVSQLGDVKHKLSELGKNRNTKELYHILDTTVLMLHQGLNDDDFQQSLMLCHRCERLLYERYDEKKVNRAISVLARVENNTKELYDDIFGRLKDYKKKTENLKSALTAANKEGDVRPSPDPDRAESRTEDYKKSFFSELEKTIDTVLLDSDAYPYLHGVLQEAINRKMADPSDNIENLIDEKL